MPELPEVEVVRRGLERGVVGRRIATVEVLHARAIRRHAAGPQDFIALLRGRTITAARRRGKYLWLPLDSGDALLGHLGMSGQLLVVPPDKPLEKHLRVRFTFDIDIDIDIDTDTDTGTGTGAPPPGRTSAQRRELRFVDQRTFGGLVVVAGGAELPSTIAHIARDPIDPEFDDAAFAAALKRRRTGIKRALLDQSLISGVGNIYADEALWRVPLHWARPTETLRAREVSALLVAVRAVLHASLEAGGTSFDALYVSTEGVSGLFERELNVYGREGEPCPRCGTAIRRESFMNRSAYSCPKDQPRPRRARW